MTIEELFVEKYKELDAKYNNALMVLETYKNRITQYEQFTEVIENSLDIESETRVWLSSHFLNKQEIELFKKVGINFENKEAENKEAENE